MINLAPPPNCATGTLVPYESTGANPWNRARVQHLFRRFGFSANDDTIETALAQAPQIVIQSLLTAATEAPNLPQPEWHNWILADYTDPNTEIVEQIYGYGRQWLGTMMTQGAKEKIVLFWHNHFVTRSEDYFCPSYLYSYHQLLQTHALGNFRTFVYEMGKTPAMLIYLNGVQNTRLDPNENYARELFELFTLGRDNGYTQADIVDAARALTGWNGFTAACAPISYTPFLHDTQSKTIFDQTGEWDYDQLHEILFTERAQEIATFICGKIYRFFVHPEPAEDIIAGLAQTFINNNWELLPVFEQLFKSEHFFDREVMGVVVKSPIDLMLGTLIEGSFPYNEDLLNGIIFGGYQLGQGLFNPVDVAGWPGDRTWINTANITGRWQFSDYILFTAFQNVPELIREFAQSLTTEDANDPDLVTQAIVDFLVPRGLLTPEAYDAATAVLKWEVPQNYYDDGSWNLYWDTVPAQVALLMQHISRIPAFQLS